MKLGRLATLRGSRFDFSGGSGGLKHGSAQFCSVSAQFLLSGAVAHGSTLSESFFFSHCFRAAILVGACGLYFCDVATG